MRITDVRACQPDTPDCPADWRLSMGQILVAVDTDRGLTGYGVGGGGAAGVHVVRTVLRDALMGENPANIEELWRRMYEATLPFGRKGLAIMALSGADLALWDLRGKAEESPVVRLLGGEPGAAIPAYVTLRGGVDDLLDQGFRAFKADLAFGDPNPPVERVIDHVHEVRANIGPDCRLMFDAFMKWDVPTALRAAQAMQSAKLDWFEEPIPPDDWKGYARLSRECPIPVAGGEHEYAPAGFEELIERRLHAVLQPDVCWCGGMTTLVEVYRMAKAAGLRVCPHRGAEPWGLHGLAALDPEPLAESGRHWMTWLKGQPEIRDGLVALADRPGFGIDIDEAALP